MLSTRNFQFPKLPRCLFSRLGKLVPGYLRVQLGSHGNVSATSKCDTSDISGVTTRLLHACTSRANAQHGCMRCELNTPNNVLDRSFMIRDA